MQRGKFFLGVGLAIILGGMANSAKAQSEIKIGEINSYSLLPAFTEPYRKGWQLDRKSTRLNSSHLVISYAVFCLKKKTTAILCSCLLLVFDVQQLLTLTRTLDADAYAITSKDTTLVPLCLDYWQILLYSVIYPQR